jgi:repressor LexA
MTIYERIKNRRKELGLSADDVAEALGVSRATIYRYESSYIEKVPITSLEPLANVLKCTPAYLMGWEDSEEDQAISRILDY